MYILYLFGGKPEVVVICQSEIMPILKIACQFHDTRQVRFHGEQNWRDDLMSLN